MTTNSIKDQITTKQLQHPEEQVQTTTRSDQRAKFDKDGNKGNSS